MRRPWLRMLAAAAAPIFALTLPMAPVQATPGVLVFPGMEIRQGANVCTLGYVDPQVRIAFTAGHCRGSGQVTDRDGNVTRLVYDSPRPHYLTQVIDPLGRTGVRTEYDGQGRLVKLVDAAGKAVALAYDPTHSTETVTDALDHPTTFEYDERGNVITEVNALGGTTRRTYDGANDAWGEPQTPPPSLAAERACFRRQPAACCGGNRPQSAGAAGTACRNAGRA